MRVREERHRSLSSTRTSCSRGYRRKELSCRRASRWTHPPCLRRLQHGNGRRHSLGELQGRMPPKDLSDLMQGCGGRKHWIRRPSRIRRTDGLSRDAKDTWRCTGHEGTEEYPTHSSDVPDLRGLPWCRLILRG